LVCREVVVVNDSNPGFANLAEELKKLESYHTLVGYPGDSPLKEDRKKKTGKYTVAEVAAVHEFGSVARNIPARPFMAQTADSKQNQSLISRIGESALINLYAGKLTAEQALTRIGEAWIGLTKQTFITGKFAPLSKRTIKAKKSSRPLIDTAQLRNSVTQVIRTGNS
jgi:hypothetical protein